MTEHDDPTARAGNLDVAYTTDAIRARKVARIRRERSGRFAFTSVFRHEDRHIPYVAVATAHCAHHDAHRAPEPGCRCGFYALRHDSDLDQLVENAIMLDELVVLDVDLTGTVIEATNGYRAGTQTVLAATLSDRCSRCPQHAEAVKVALNGFITPRCRRHAGRRRIELTQLAAGLGTEVRFGDIGPFRQPFPMSAAVAVSVAMAAGGLFPGVIAAMAYHSPNPMTATALYTVTAGPFLAAFTGHCARIVRTLARGGRRGVATGTAVGFVTYTAAVAAVGLWIGS